ncbi:MAG: hypothetical protein RL708_1894 [Bacteroidota bacterium]|jgi:hypothetical protein
MKTIIKYVIVVYILVGGGIKNTPLFAQISLTNPSFESSVSWFNKIEGWDSCSSFYYVASIPTPYVFFSPPPLLMVFCMAKLEQMEIIQVRLVI